MARYNKVVKEEKQEQEKKEQIKEGSKTVMAILLSILAVAILVFIVVIIVLQIKQSNKSEEEENNETKTYEATYTKENTPGLVEITLDDLEDILDNDTHSEYAKPTVYVLIYTPNYDAYKKDDKEADGSTEEFQNAVKAACLNEDEKTGFYVINVLSTDNKESSSSVLTDNSISYSTNGYVLVKITYNSEKQTNDLESYKILVDVLDELESLSAE